MSSTQTLEVPVFQVIQFLGSGARSTIWQVRDRQTEEIVSVVYTLLGDNNFGAVEW